MKNTIYLLILFLIYSLTSCTTERKATKYFNNHLEKLAPLCVETFPPKDSTVTKDSIRFDTLYIEGEPVILKDSFYIKGDTVVRVITKECPKVQTVIKTEIKEVTHYVENTAKVKVLENVIANDNKTIQKQAGQIEDRDNKIKGKNGWIWKLIIVVAIETIILFRKPLISLVKPLIGIPPIG